MPVAAQENVLQHQELLSSAWLKRERARGCHRCHPSAALCPPSFPPSAAPGKQSLKPHQQVLPSTRRPPGEQGNGLTRGTQTPKTAARSPRRERRQARLPSPAHSHLSSGRAALLRKAPTCERRQSTLRNPGGAQSAVAGTAALGATPPQGIGGTSLIAANKPSPGLLSPTLPPELSARLCTTRYQKRVSRVKPERSVGVVQPARARPCGAPLPRRVASVPLPHHRNLLGCTQEPRPRLPRAKLRFRPEHPVLWCWDHK